MPISLENKETEAASRLQNYESGSVAWDKDCRPEHSAYASEVCAVYFQGNGPLHIPLELLNQNAELASLDMAMGLHPLSLRELHLNDIAYDTGHILVHFLHTGSYQCLKPHGDTTAKRYTSEFTTALRAYIAAQSLQLLSLRDLARGEMIRLGNKLSLLSLIDIMEESWASLSTSPAIVAYAESRFLTFAESVTRPMAEKVLSEIGTPNTLSKVLLKTMLLLKISEVPQRDGSFQKDVLVEMLRGLTDSKPGAGASRSTVSDADQAMKEAEEQVACEAKEQAAAIAVAQRTAATEADESEADREEEEFARAAPPADEEKACETPAEEDRPSEDDKVAEVALPAGESKSIEEEESVAQEAEAAAIASEETELAALVAKTARAKSKKRKLGKKDFQRLAILTENAAKRAEAKAAAASTAAKSAPPVDEEDILEDKPAEATTDAEEKELADQSFVFPLPKVKSCESKDDSHPYRLRITGDIGFPERVSADAYDRYIRVSPSSSASDNSFL